MRVWENFLSLESEEMCPTYHSDSLSEPLGGVPPIKIIHHAPLYGNDPQS